MVFEPSIRLPKLVPHVCALGYLLNLMLLISVQYTLPLNQKNGRHEGQKVDNIQT